LKDYPIDRVVVFNRTDSGKAARTKDIQVLVARECDMNRFELVYQHDGSAFGGVKEGQPLVVNLKEKGIEARVVRLQVRGVCSFALDEIEVYGAGAMKTNLALHKPADQKSVGAYSKVHPVGRLEPVAGSAAEDRFPLAHTRQVLDRARALASRLQPRADRNRLGALLTQWHELNGRLRPLEADRAVPLDTRRTIHFAARRLARQIAFTNPLLDFDKILFIKKHDPAGVFHMCDQFYGVNARPGGGLFALIDPFGDRPKLADVLDGSTVGNGRLARQSLDGGSFLSPELSFDGKTILFAYTQAKGWDKYQGKEAYEWRPEFSYHIFRCNADGSGLVQLTDGDLDDFDPCFLPDGRVAFISERRGGYLRCGRHCPVYTLFSMRPDGSDIQCISFHETHEWQPSVAHTSMLVYSRWDYVDRDTNIAHHLWTSFPDGRDPRSFHGNYPVRRESRPWMEMSCRAIPGSHQYVAVTGAHHGHAFGSLVMIDPHAPDDNAASQFTRLTPEVAFAEAEGRPIQNYMVYGTPWPLSEDDYLCVYDSAGRNRGIYWIDRFGNRELLYRDPAISCLDPIPLRPRATPPVVLPPGRDSQSDIAVLAGLGYDSAR
jgi:hypothetical protein